MVAAKLLNRNVGFFLTFQCEHCLKQSHWRDYFGGVGRSGEVREWQNTSTRYSSGLKTLINCVFPLDLYIVVVIHVIRGDSCAPADTVLSVMHSQNKKFLSVPQCFPMRWQWDVGRTLRRPCWSAWWIAGWMCCPGQGSGGQGWQARADEGLTAMFCRCWWTSSPERQGHGGQTGSEEQIKGVVFAAAILWTDKAEQDCFWAKRESAVLIKVWVLRLPLKNADLGPRNLFHIHAAASNSINKPKCNMYAALPVVGGHCSLPQGTLQEKEGGQAAKPGVASQRPKVWYAWDQCQHHFDIAFFKEASSWGIKEM